jgi:hypothetical protein
MENIVCRSIITSVLASAITILAVACAPGRTRLPGETRQAQGVRARHDSTLAAQLERVRSARGVPGMGKAAAACRSVGRTRAW